jgi:hypothetical protein
VLAQAKTAAGSALPVSFILAGAAIRMKLDRPLKVRFDQAFTEEIEVKKPAAVDAALLARFIALLPAAEREYHGSKTHVKKVNAYLLRVVPPEATEPQWVAITSALSVLGAGVRILRRCAQTGQRHFPTSPAFFIIEVESWFIRGKPKSGEFYPLHHLLAEADQLARDLPPGEQRDNYLAEIAELMKKVNALNPFAAMMNATMGGFFDSDEFDDDDDDDDDIPEDEIDW